MGIICGIFISMLRRRNKNPNTVNLIDVCKESRKHIDLEERTWDITKSFRMLGVQVKLDSNKKEKGTGRTLLESGKYQVIDQMLTKLFGEHYGRIWDQWEYDHSRIYRVYKYTGNRSLEKGDFFWMVYKVERRRGTDKMSEEQILDFLVKNVDYFVTNDFVIAILRTIGWLLVKGVNYLIEGSKAIYDTTFGLIDITRYSGVQSFISEYRPLLQAVMVLSLVILGYIYIIGKEKRHDLLTSILIFAVVATSSTYLFSTFNTFTVMFKEAVIGGDNNADGKELIRQNLYDLRYIDSQIGLANMNTSGEIPQYHDLSDADLKMINIAEVLTNEEEGLTGEAKDILSKRLIYVQDKSYLEDVYNGVAMTSFGNTYYFRYQFHYGTYFLNAFSLILLYFGLGYVNVKVIVELLRSRVLVVLFSADLSSKKKAVRILESIRDEYYALCFTAIELRLYLILTDYINSKSFLSSLVREVLLVLCCLYNDRGILHCRKDHRRGCRNYRYNATAYWGSSCSPGAKMAMQAKQLSTLSNMNKARSGLDGGREGGMPGNQNDSMSGMPGNGNPDPGTETGSEDKTNRSTSRTESAEHQKDVSGSSNSEMNNRMSGAENADFKENESSTETMDADIRSNVTESSGYSPDAGPAGMGKT